MNACYTPRFTEEAEEDLRRLYAYLLERAPDGTTDVAERALEAIEHGFAVLGRTPYTCRKATPDNPYLRELLIPFGATGYIALFEIEPGEIVTVLAVRHQRESDYH
ncbi:type II toxin-antitoxin system RelE/ParE family toxin [Ottowia sp.]|uniref:type II toxin-antitoxin system RelE/ParE family toxin n=1 Tax=Ottowia sp. TaxID=1898956 RepID=UPI0039E61F4A